MSNQTHTPSAIRPHGVIPVCLAALSMYAANVRCADTLDAGACGAFLLLEDGFALRPPGFCNVNELFETNTEQARAIEVTRGPGSARDRALVADEISAALSAGRTAGAERTAQRRRAVAVARLHREPAHDGRFGRGRRAQLPGRISISADTIHYRYDNLMLSGNTDQNGNPCGSGGCLYSRPADRSDHFNDS